MTNKDKTGGERQSRLRKARKEWLAEHGYRSAEGLIGALMRGEVILQNVNVPTPREPDKGEGSPLAALSNPEASTAFGVSS